MILFIDNDPRRHEAMREVADDLEQSAKLLNEMCDPYEPLDKIDNLSRRASTHARKMDAAAARLREKMGPKHFQQPENNSDAH